MTLHAIFGRVIQAYVTTLGDGSAYSAGLAGIGVTLLGMFFVCLALLLGLAINRQIDTRVRWHLHCKELHETERSRRERVSLDARHPPKPVQILRRPRVAVHEARSLAMNWEQVEGQWKQFSGQVKSTWAKLTDDDLKNLSGKKDDLLGKIQERYGVMKEEAEKQVDE